MRLGADEAFESGARLPARVDAVFETVGLATWSHSLKALRPGGTVVVSGATTGDPTAAELQRIFFLQLQVIGSTMGTRAELVDLLAFCQLAGLVPHIGAELPLAAADQALGSLLAGDAEGKLVLTV